MVTEVEAEMVTEVGTKKEGKTETSELTELGIAYDLGTTTLAGFLWNLKEKRLLASAAIDNPQKIHGKDVISRITFTQKNLEGLKILQEEIVSALYELKDILIKNAGIETKFKADFILAKIVLAGNSTMSHLLLKKNPQGLALAPFKPAYEGTVIARVKDLGIPGVKDLRDSEGKNLGFPEDLEFLLLPNIGGHVGGDITGGILASGILSKEGNHLFLDIGTNGEVVLAQNGRGLASSTAAGPAFEGAALSCGSRAIDGAIDYVEIIDGKPKIHTINEKDPVGICGTGILSLIAEMTRKGLIDKSGKLISYEIIDGEKRFLLTEKIYISQKDIREIQLAKAAIRAGVEAILLEGNIKEEDIDSLAIGGAFGNTINIDDALAIALIPGIDPALVNFLGNSAGTGASMALTDEGARKESEKIPGKIKHFELALNPLFQELFLRYLDF